MATARMYFTSEEEYVAHWNSFHAAISPWFICPANGTPYVAAREPDALDWYLDHVVNHPEEGQPGISVRWQMRQLIESIHDQQYPRNLQVDIPPVTDGKRRNRRSGVKVHARWERAAQMANQALSSTATSCSSSSRYKSKTDYEAMLKHLLRGTCPQQTTLQTHRGAALCYEDVVSNPEAAGEADADCWTLERIQTQYR